MSAKITASSDGLYGSLAVGALEALAFKPIGGGLELSQDGTIFQTVDADGKVAFPGNVIPAFSATGTGGLTTNTTAKVTGLITEQFDTANCFSSSRFTPTVAGYYQIQGGVGGAGIASSLVLPKLFKNGADSGSVGSGAGNELNGNYWSAMVSGLIYLNGTTDYVELWTTVIGAPSMNTCAMSGCLVRAA